MATTELAVQTQQPKRSLVGDMAGQYGMEPGKFLETIKATVFPSGSQVTNEQLAAFMIVANQHGLNPFIREIYAFPGRGSGIVPIVSIDGWTALINRQKNLDGVEFEDRMKDGKLAAITCRIFRKDRGKPTEVTEYLSECSRDTEPWKKWPARMLRHKALIQCARYAFSLSGIFDDDEAERIETPSGRLEIETDSPLRVMPKVAPAPPTPPETQAAATPAAPVYIQVDKQLTIISGGYRPIESDLPKVGGRWDKVARVWTMPAARTEELVSLCNSKNLPFVELDANGQPLVRDEQDQREPGMEEEPAGLPFS